MGGSHDRRMEQTLPIRDLLLGLSGFGDGDAGETDAGAFLRSGLQELLTLLVAIYAAAAARRKSVSPGFAARFGESMTRPTAGGLHQFLTWLTSQDVSPSVTNLSVCLRDKRAGADRWLREMVELRNRWQHREEQGPEQVLATTGELLRHTPAFEGVGTAHLSDDGAVSWVAPGGAHRLEPFVFWAAGTVQVFRTFEAPDRLVFRESNPAMQALFRELWAEIRLLDRALEAPGARDICGKARRATTAYTGSAPWWFERVLKPGPIAVLVAPGLLDGFLAECGRRRSDAAWADLSLRADEVPARSFAMHLGLANAPMPDEFATWMSESPTLIVALRTGALSSQRFLKVLNWVADVGTMGKDNALHVCVERDEAHLRKDQERLWDSLPENLIRFFRKPPRSSGAALPNLLWPAQRRRPWGGP